jgi:hypothetical protein
MGPQGELSAHSLGIMPAPLSAELRPNPFPTTSSQPVPGPDVCSRTPRAHRSTPHIHELNDEPDFFSMSSAVMNVALFGTGLYAQSDYIPAFLSKDTKSVRVHTIWSLDEDAAKACASQLSSDGPEPKVLARKDDIEVILQDPTIDAIVMVLPFMYQPDIIRRAWKAGKHVLSEKPIERDTKAAMALVREYEETWASKGLVWRVAEGTYESR